jgi:hypothetical protein
VSASPPCPGTPPWQSAKPWTGRAHHVRAAELPCRRCAALAPVTKTCIEVVTPEQAREHYRRQGGFAAANADFLLGFTDYQGNKREPTSAQRPSTKTPIPVESRKVRACRSMTTCDGLPVALHAAFAAPFAPARVVPDRGDLRRAVGAGQGLRRDHGSAGGPCGAPRGLRRAAGRAGRMLATRSRPRAAVLPRSWT